MAHMAQNISDTPKRDHLVDKRAYGDYDRIRGFLVPIRSTSSSHLDKLKGRIVQIAYPVTVCEGEW